METKTRENILALLIIILCLFALLVGLFFNKTNHSKSDPNQKKLVNNIMGDKVEVLVLEGLIYDTVHAKNPFKTLHNVASLKEDLYKAIADKQTKAVLLRVNSPGGTVAASQEVYALIHELRKAGKPVVVSVGDVCASGCYYIASAADAIVANRGSLTGSIGVISQGLNFKGLLDKLGIADQTFKTGKFKDLASPTRTLNPEEVELLQNLINDSYEQFITDVSDSRKINIDELRKVAQGQVYTGKQALGIKLVDHLGTYDDAKKITLDVLKDKYGYKNIDKLNFEESWTRKNLSSFDDLLDLGLSDSKYSSWFTDLFATMGITPVVQNLSINFANVLWLAQ